MPEEVFPFDLEESKQEVPGELLVKLTRDGELSVTESIPSGPIRRLAEPIPDRLGIESVDKILAETDATAVVKLHSVVPQSLIASAESGEAATALATTYRVRFDDPSKVAEAAQRLERTNAVAEVSRNYYRYTFDVTPNDPMFGLQWGLRKIRCPEAWERTKGSSSVVVGVIDTGVDLDHPELAPLLLPGQDLVDLAGISPPLGWHFEGDFLTRDNVPADEVGHGTHVAGTIAALSDNATGVAGVTWNCRLLPVKVLARVVRNSDGLVRGSGTAVDIAAGIRWAADNGAHIVNLSLGGTVDTFVERDAVAYAVSRGVLVIAAMGNAFPQGNPTSYPAAYPNVVAVGAVDQSERRASFSQTGPHIDISGPGVGIRSTDWDDTYSDKSGTSMATPHVAGVAALVKSCKSSLTAGEIAEILRETAKPLRDDAGDPVPNDQYGHGLVDARAALDRACPQIKLKFFDDPITLKFRDDVTTLKFLDDPITLKFRDDPTTLKFRDDIVTLKFLDDGGTLKFTDDLGTNPIADQPPPFEGPERSRGEAGAAPFVLSTPHHSMAWAGAEGEELEAVRSQYEEAIQQAEQALTEMHEASQQGQLTPEEARRFESLAREYQSMVADYQQLRQGGRGRGGSER